MGCPERNLLPRPLVERLLQPPQLTKLLSARRAAGGRRLGAGPALQQVPPAVVHSQVRHVAAAIDRVAESAQIYCARAKQTCNLWGVVALAKQIMQPLGRSECEQHVQPLWGRYHYT